MKLGLMGSLVWVNSHCKKQCRSIFWRMRAAVKKAVIKNGSYGRRNRQFKYQYDPCSYALNFDDGLGGDCSGFRNIDFGTAQPNSTQLSLDLKLVEFSCACGTPTIASTRVNIPKSQQQTSTASTTWVYVVLWVE